MWNANSFLQGLTPVADSFSHNDNRYAKGTFIKLESQYDAKDGVSNWGISKIISTQSSEAVEYADYISSGGKTLPTSVLDMTQNNLMLRLQSWSSGKSEVRLHCHGSQVHSNPEW